MIPLSTKPSTVQQGSPSQSDPEHHCRAQQNRVAFFAFLPRYNVYLYNKRVNERLATAEPTSRIAASLGERGKTRQGPQRGETFEDRRSGVDDTPSMVDGYREGITVCVDEGDQVIIVLIRKCTSPVADAVP